MLFVLNGPTQFFQYTSDFIVVPCCINSTMSTPILPQKTVAITFLADSVRLKFSACLANVCIQCFDCFLVSAFTYEAHKFWAVVTEI
jgi:hypothetical protein